MARSRQMTCPGLILTILIFAICSRSGAQDEDPRVERAEALERMAVSLENVRVDREKPRVDRSNENRHVRRESELHFRFLVSLTALENENRDALVLVPVEVNGRTFELDSLESTRPELRSGQDLQKARVAISDFFTIGNARARVEMPELNHGSEYNAVRLARDEIHRRIEWYLPDVVIEGEQKRLVRQLAVVNGTDERLRLWLHYSARERTESGYSWRWSPGQPETGSAAVLTIPANETTIVRYLAHGDSAAPIEASRVRFWAEGEDSGRRWEEHRWDDLWLVERNAELDGERAYYSAEIQTFEYRIEPQSGDELYNQRVLRLVNSTPEPLSADVRYLTRSPNGSWRWWDANVELDPGASIVPRDEHGAQVRASRIIVSAESEHRRYAPESADGLWLVEESGGVRGYRAEGIGTFEYVFEAKGDHADPQVARIRSNEAPIERSGEGVVRTAQRDETFEVLDERSGWIRVRLPESEGSGGWIRASDVELTGSRTETRPQLDLGTLVVRSAQADVQIDNEVIEQLSRGSRHPILEERSGWYRIRLSDSERHGWIRGADVTVEP